MIRYVALTMLLIAATPAEQAGPDSREQAQRLIFAALDDARFTVFRSNPPVLGWYKGGNSEACLTRYVLNIPAHVVDGASVPAKNYSFGVNWREVKDAAPEPSDPLKIRVTRTNATEWFTLSGSRRAQFLSGAAYLIKACKEGAAPPAVPRNVGERYMIEEYLPGTPQCRFRQIPDLLLIDRKPPGVTSMLYKVSPRESGGKNNYFAVSGQSGKQSYRPDDNSNWRGALAEPGFWIDSAKHEAQKIASAILLADGRATGIPLYRA
jgi:hypothetical protein